VLKNKAEEGRTISIFRRSARGNLIALKNKKKTKLENLKSVSLNLKSVPTLLSRKEVAKR